MYVFLLFIFFLFSDAYNSSDGLIRIIVVEVLSNTSLSVLVFFFFVVVLHATAEVTGILLNFHGQRNWFDNIIFSIPLSLF